MDFRPDYEYPLYVYLLSLAGDLGGGVPELSVVMVLVIASIVFLTVKAVSEVSAGLLAGGLFLASPFVLSQTLVFSSHSHMGLMLALFAVWLTVSGLFRKKLFAFLSGIVAAAAVIASYHSALLVLGVAAVIIMRRSRRSLLLLIVAGALFSLIVFYMADPGAIRNYLASDVYERSHTMIHSDAQFGMNWLYPYYLLSECENGFYSLMILLFLSAGLLMIVTRGDETNVCRARDLLIIALVSLMFFQILPLKMDRVFYLVWSVMIAFSAAKVMDLFKRVRGRDFSWVIPSASIIIMFGFWVPDTQSIVSLCRSGIEMLPTEESRRGVFVSGDNNMTPLGLPQIKDAALLGETVDYVIVRKYPLPSLCSLPENPGARHLFVRELLYEQLFNAEEVRLIHCWRSSPRSFYFSIHDYFHYNRGLWQPGPSLVVPAELFFKTWNSISKQLYPDE